MIITPMTKTTELTAIIKSKIGRVNGEEGA